MAPRPAYSGGSSLKVGQIGDRPAGHGREHVVDRIGGKTAPTLPLGSLGARFRPVIDPPVDPLARPPLFTSLAQLADGRGQKIDAPALLIVRRLQFGNGTGLLRDGSARAAAGTGIIAWWN